MVGVVGGFGARCARRATRTTTAWSSSGWASSADPITARLMKVEETWRGAGFRVKVFDDIDQLVWEKLICNCSLSGPCAVSDLTVGEVMADPDMAKISADCATEAFHVAREKGVRLGFDDPVAYTPRVRLENPGGASRRCCSI